MMNGNYANGESSHSNNQCAQKGTVGDNGMNPRDVLTGYLYSHQLPAAYLHSYYGADKLTVATTSPSLCFGAMPL